MQNTKKCKNKKNVKNAKMQKCKNSKKQSRQLLVLEYLLLFYFTVSGQVKDSFPPNLSKKKPMVK